MSNLPKQLRDLVATIAKLPDDAQDFLAYPLSQLIRYEEALQASMSEAKELLSQARLDLKYLLFDLEATRRERDELREKYE